MGLFDKFKKKKEEPTPMQSQEEKDNMAIPVRQYMDKNEKKYCQLDYYSLSPEIKRQMYDSTRLIVDQNPEFLPSGHKVYNAKVSWYGIYDCEYIVDGEDIGRKSDMENIRLELDMDKFMNDREYQDVLMTKLLSKNRVMRYKEQGLQDNPEHQCGNYIGYVDRNENGNYIKKFDLGIGEEVHALPEQVNRRQRYKEKLEKDKQARNAERERKIKELQDAMEK